MQSRSSKKNMFEVSIFHCPYSQFQVSNARFVVKIKHFQNFFGLKSKEVSSPSKCFLKQISNNFIYKPIKKNKEETLLRRSYSVCLKNNPCVSITDSNLMFCLKLISTKLVFVQQLKSYDILSKLLKLLKNRRNYFPIKIFLSAFQEIEMFGKIQSHA